jgi:hypothetical protein
MLHRQNNFRNLELRNSPFKARFTLCRVPEQRREVGVKGRGIA